MHEMGEESDFGYEHRLDDSAATEPLGGDYAAVTSDTNIEDEIPEVAPGDCQGEQTTAADRLDRLRAEADGTIQGYLAASRAELASGAYLTHVCDSSKVVSEVAQDALASGDTAAYEGHLELSAEHGRVDGLAFAEACFAGINEGNQRAFEILSDALEAEKATTTERVAAELAKRPHDEPNTHASMLSGVVWVCEAEGRAADTWIDKYAINEEQRWLLSFDHRRRSAELGTEEDAAFHQRRLDAIAAQLADGDFVPEFIDSSTPLALEGAKDPAVRARLVERYKQAGTQTALNRKTYKTTIQVGLQVLRDPDLATQEQVEFFEQAVEYCGYNLVREGTENRFDVNDDQAPWHVALKRFNGATPQELLEEIDYRTGALMLDVYTAESGDDDFKERVADKNRRIAALTRESLIGDEALRCASEGDFASARFFHAHLAEAHAIDKTLGKCLDLATGLEQVHQLTPDADTLGLYPWLNTHVRFAEARITGDTQCLSEVAIACRQNFRDSDLRSTYAYVRKAFDLVRELDPAQAMRLAKSLVSIGREEEIPYSTMSYLSRWLVDHGDMEEARLALEDLKHPYNESFQLVDTWRLLRILNNRPTEAN